MRYGVIDIGSNSVRLLISEDGKGLKKVINTTRLAEGLKDGLLQKQPILRTLKAVKEYAHEAKTYEVKDLFIFATAAVRNARNGGRLVGLIEKECGLKVDVVSGETEATLGVLGALCGKDGAVLDIGGGSTEIAVVKGGNIVYSKSLPFGAVVLTNEFGQDSDRIRGFVREKVTEYGKIPTEKFYCIGGTCTSLAAISQQLLVYDPEKTDGYKLTVKRIKELSGYLSDLSVEERKSVVGLQKERANIIHAGAIIFEAVAEYLDTDFIVSESDNLEGYLIYKTEKR